MSDDPWVEPPRHRAGAAVPIAVVAVVVAAGGAVAVLTGGGHANGGTAPASASPSEGYNSPGDLLDSAAAALRSVTAAHVRGTVGGAHGPVGVDLQATHGGASTGTLTVAGVPVRVVRTSGSTYIRSEALVRDIGGSLAARLAGDHWLKIGSGLLQRAGIDKALDEASALPAIANLIATVAPAAATAQPVTDGGVPALRIAAGPTTVDVRRSSPHYPVRVQASGSVQLTLSQFGQSVSIQPPTSGVIDLGKLPGIG